MEGGGLLSGRFFGLLEVFFSFLLEAFFFAFYLALSPSHANILTCFHRI